MKNTYRSEQETKNTEKIKELQHELPSFTSAYFAGMLNGAGRNYSSLTVLNYARDIELFFYYLSENNPEIKDIKSVTPEFLENLTPFDMDEYMIFLTCYDRDGKNYTNTESGKNRKKSSLKNFWKWMLANKIVENNPTLLITNSKPKDKPIVRVKDYEIPDLVRNVETGQGLTEKSFQFSKNTRLRDFALISLLLGTGIRVSECVGINLENINFKENSVLIARKGGHEDIVYFNETVAERLKDYIKNERIVPTKKEDSSALFVSKQGKRICVRSVENLVKKYAKTIGRADVTPHKLRATFATELYEQTSDPIIVRDALGHHGFGSLDKYADAKTKHKKEAAQNIKWLND